MGSGGRGSPGGADHGQNAARAGTTSLAAGRFVVRRRLGAGGMGIVFEAYDTALDQVVALKQLRSAAPHHIVRFKREFRALADVVHPSLVTLHDLVVDGERWLLSMELVDGVDFLSHVRGVPGSLASGTAACSSMVGDTAAEPTSTVEPVSVTTLATGRMEEPSLRYEPAAPPLASSLQFARLRAALPRLVDGIATIHDHGYLHRDIKPSNVLVQSDGRVVVLDFGIVGSLGDRDEGGWIAGTPAYMPPEIGTSGQAGAASDWYSVGVLLFEALTGRRPFIGGSEYVLASKRAHRAPECRSVVPAAPADLAELCDALLDRDPTARPTVGAIRAALGAPPAASPRLAFATRASGAPQRSGALVGRTRELSLLHDAFDSVAHDGLPRCVRVHGESGVGKSALVEQFVREAHRDAGALVLVGRCRPHELLPYKALDGVIDALARHLAELPEQHAGTLLPDDIGALARLFPVLAGVPAVAAASELDLGAGGVATELRRRGFAALTALLGNIAQRSTVVIDIDDAQWGDRDSALALVSSLDARHTPAMLMLLSYRTDEADASPFLRTLEQSLNGEIDLPIGPLAVGDSLALARACLRERGGRRDFADAVVREAGGLPLLIAELARACAERDSDDPGPLRLASVLVERVATLPLSAQRLLETLTVAGHPVARLTALTAAGDARATDIKALCAVRLARTVRSGDSDAVEIYHDRIRDCLLAEMTAEAARAGHRTLAEAVDAREPENLEALALHWDRAGDATRAAACHQRAGDRAAASLAFERAVLSYRRALELEPGTGDARAALLAKLGAALSSAGDSAAAATAYRDAAACAEPPRGVSYAGREAEELLRSDQIDDGIARLREVLAATGEPLPRTTIGLFALLAHQRLRLALRGTAVRERDQPVAAGELRRLDLYRKSLTSLSLADPLQGFALHCRYVRAALDAGDPAHAAVALSVEAVFRSLAGPTGRSAWRTLIDRAHDTAVACGDPIAHTYAHYGAAYGHYTFAEFAEARAALLRARSHVRTAHWAHWEAQGVEQLMQWTLYYLGEIDLLSRSVHALYVDASSRADRALLAIVCTGHAQLCWLTRDDTAGARRVLHDVESRAASTGYHFAHHRMLMSHVQTELYCGDGARALEYVRRDWPALRRSPLWRVIYNRTRAIHDCVRATIAAAADAEPAAARGLVRAAARENRRLARVPTPLARALSLLQSAGIARLRGQLEASVTALRSGIEACDGTGLSLYAAAARRQLGATVEGDEGRALIDAADQRMTGQAIARPGRVAAMLVPGFDPS